MVDVPRKGYVAVCETRTGKYLCLPEEDLQQKNWLSEKAVIYDEISGVVHDEMLFQAAFKWSEWFLLDGIEV
jgi:hypothetical protein